MPLEEGIAFNVAKLIEVRIYNAGKYFIYIYKHELKNVTYRIYKSISHWELNCRRDGHDEHQFDSDDACKSKAHYFKKGKCEFNDTCMEGKYDCIQRKSSLLINTTACDKEYWSNLSSIDVKNGNMDLMQNT